MRVKSRTFHATWLVLPLLAACKDDPAPRQYDPFGETSTGLPGQTSGGASTTGWMQTSGTTGGVSTGAATTGTSGFATGVNTAGTGFTTGGTNVGLGTSGLTSGGTTWMPPGTSTTAGVGDATGGSGLTTTGDTGVPVDAGPPPDAGPACEEALASGVQIDELAIYQAVKIGLMKDGTAVTNRNAPVVQGRSGLIRAFVRPEGGSARPLRGVLHLRNGSEEKTYEAMGTPSASPSDADLDSTFNFEVEGEDLGPDVEYRVTIEEGSCDLAADDAPGAAFPADGYQALDPTDTGVLRVALVPVHYTAGNYDVTAEATEADVERYREALMRVYPAREVEVRVRETLDWSNPVYADGGGWSELLNNILRLQSQEAAAGEYYYGLIATRDTFQSFCSRGCVAGMAPVPQSGGFFGGARATGGLGIGYDHYVAGDTLAHELGHAHGRLHAPCAPGGRIDGSDNSFPYDEARIGVWGYDILSGELMAPSGDDSRADMMSYCEPIWISDYTYRKIAEWMQEVSTSPRVITKRSGVATAWKSLIVHADGSARWGTWEPAYPSGRAESARVLAADGSLVTTIDIARMAMDHADDEFVFVPPTEPGWARLQLSDREIVLADVEPALQ